MKKPNTQRLRDQGVEHNPIPDFIILDNLLEIHEELVSSVSKGFYRYLYHEINWNNRLIIITGLRGVGKSTMLLQYARDHQDNKKILYLSADNTMVNSLGLFEIGKTFYQEGGQCLILDEVHKYPEWTQILKNLYDSFPKLQIIASGSSSLDLSKGQYDLSRRSMIYSLQGLSFREFLQVAYDIEYQPVSLKDIITNHQQLARQVKQVIEKKGEKILPLFREYLRWGYFPFFLEGKSEYPIKLRSTLTKILYEDIFSAFHISQSSIPYLHKLIYLVATSHSFKPNIAKISSQLGIAKETVYNFFHYLIQAQVFISLQRSNQGLKKARKPERIYLNNTNFYFALVGSEVWKTNIGSIRESFMVNQLSQCHKIEDIDAGDVLVEGKYIFEIGGKNKGSSQVKYFENAYLVKDNIETGAQKSIPLFLFGFLY